MTTPALSEAQKQAVRDYVAKRFAVSEEGADSIRSGKLDESLKSEFIGASAVLSLSPAGTGEDALRLVARSLARKIVVSSVRWLGDGNEKEHENYVLANWKDEIKEAEELIVRALLSRMEAGGEKPIRDESAWLIEWPDERQLPLRWWNGDYGYTRDPNETPRFARKEDAEMVMRSFKLVGAKAVEHIWTAPLPSPEPKPAARNEGANG